MKPLRVLVCGSNYSRIYLEAIRMGGTGYHLAGILARGSARSQQVASEHGVPLYLSVEDLPSGIDLACAAMGTSGSDAVLSLLARGIHVLCEHPQKPNYIQSALDAAASSRVCFHVNGHFADLEAAAAFIHYCRQEGLTASPQFFHVTATDRSLYAALDILRRIMASFGSSQFHVISRLPPFAIVQGLLGGVSATFHLQSAANGNRLPDASPSYLVDHRIAASFPSGTVTLLSMNGPVVWNANLNRATDPAGPLFRVVHAEGALDPQMLYKERVTATLAAVVRIVKSIRDRATPPEQTPVYLLDVSRTWESLGGLL
jgi:thiazolinyl imide reductase